MLKRFRQAFIHFFFRLWVYLKRSFIITSSYKTQFILSFVNIFLSFLSFYFLATFLDTGDNPFLTQYGGSYIQFTIVGVIFASFLSFAFSFMMSAVSEGVGKGTLEYLLLSKVGLIQITIMSSLWSMLFLVVNTVVTLVIVKFILGVTFFYNLWLIALVLLLAMFAITGIGMISAGIIVVIKSGDPISFVFGALTGLLSGVAFPVEILPAFLREIGEILPNTHALTALREVMINNASLWDIKEELAFLFISSVITLAIGYFVFIYGFHRARQKGTLALR